MAGRSVGTNVSRSAFDQIAPPQLSFPEPSPALAGGGFVSGPRGKKRHLAWALRASPGWRPTSYRSEMSNGRRSMEIVLDGVKLHDPLRFPAREGWARPRAPPRLARLHRALAGLP